MKYEIINSGSEVWKPIKDFEDKYEISNMGRLKNIKTNHILKMTNKKGGYFSIILYDKDKKRSSRIHRLVAETFIPNPDNLPQVNHINCNKQDNRVENLEWCSRSENMKHAIQSGLGVLKGINKYNKNKSYLKYGYIYQFDLNNNFIAKYYDSQKAQQKTGVCARNILQCINHEEGRKQAGGYIWLKESEVVNCEI